MPIKGFRKPYEFVIAVKQILIEFYATQASEC